jgi:hypothetical protein
MIYLHYEFHMNNPSDKINVRPHRTLAALMATSILRMRQYSFPTFIRQVSTYPDTHLKLRECARRHD